MAEQALSWHPVRHKLSTMTPVYQTRQDKPDGNCLAACVATILDKSIEDVDVDVASCASIRKLLSKIEEKANCTIYRLDFRAITDGIVKVSDRYCIASVCTTIFNNDPHHPNSAWHAVVCEISEAGEVSQVFNPTKTDNRCSLQQFFAVDVVLIVRHR
jgi:hypothetical protein